MTDKDLSHLASNGDENNGRDNDGPEYGGEKILKRIEQSAEHIEVPESLLPENMLKKLEEAKQGKADEKKFRFRNPKLIGALSAAAVLLICCISLRGMQINKYAGSILGESAAAPAEGTEEAALETEECVAEDAAEMADAGAGAERKNAGELYTLADSYDEVYERLEDIKAARKTAESGADGVFVEESSGEGMFAEMEDTAATSGIRDLQEEKQSSAVEKAERYSETNVQTFGIDESDIVKTDGEYLYLLRGSCVSIVRAGEKMEQVGEIKPDTESGSADVCAMYVDGDRLILMAQEYTTTMEEKESGDDAYYDMLYLDTGKSVSVLTYDITDKKAPVLAGKATQDGNYVTSRKDGNIVYLFTEQYLMEDYEKDPSDAIPEVNARKVAADCIYVGERGERALIISSLSLYSPDTVRDTVMILDNGSEIYMGADSLYLYRTNYQENGEITEIAKFSLTGGFLNGEAAVSVRGSVRDTFAVHEKDRKLRVLTTDMSGAEWENCLFLLDENLRVTGELSHIAVGESIYAARYLGDMAYFITYRNTDPLFAVDLSDEKHPKLLGELKITGFSEYLHFWGEDRLLGLGYETDPESGAQEGLKLVMFDMSDPAELKVLGTEVLTEMSYSPALYDYKAVLADPGENLIGFVGESYKKGVKQSYELYRWTEEGFEKILSENLTEDGYDDANYRGLYIGDSFYIAHPEVVRSYDRTDYSLRETLKIE